MKVDFSSQPDFAKVWVYQANRELSQPEISRIEEISDFFLSQWESHKIPVNGSFDIYENRFIVISAFSDEDTMCGRAQDAQMRLVKELEDEIGCVLTDRMLVCYEEKEEVKTFHFSELSELLKNNQISSDTLIYNSLVSTKKEFETQWKAAIKNTWLKQFV